MENKTNKITSTTEVKRGQAGAKKNKYGVPGVWEIFSINDMW